MANSNIFEELNKVAKKAGIVKNSENNGGVNIYKKEIFEGKTSKEIKSLRKKLRDNYVIPLLENIVSCKDKKEFNERKKDFLDVYKTIFIPENFDFSVFGMLRNNNKELAEKAQKTWEKFSNEK